MLHDYLIVYEIKDDERSGMVRGNVTVHDFPLTQRALKAVCDKVSAVYNEGGGCATQSALILNVIQLDKELEGVVTEYDVEATV